MQLVFEVERGKVPWTD